MLELCSLPPVSCAIIAIMNFSDSFAAQGSDTRTQEADPASSMANSGGYSLGFILENGNGYEPFGAMNHTHHEPNGMTGADMQMSTVDILVCYGMVRVL